ncbi:hypothetical protein CEXT_103811 [Caerostris extrusa]|uniref:Uncharacterized protein n=1 Tax=Caerostris extrusa TaxID=172846 RepID=A0AAV4QAS7_CAEEX|nr:hypothetical protein CEXT_103811 [Caerostris extrusa]
MRTGYGTLKYWSGGLRPNLCQGGLRLSEQQVGSRTTALNELEWLLLLRTSQPLHPGLALTFVGMVMKSTSSLRPGGQVARALAFGIPGFRFESWWWHGCL